MRVAPAHPLVAGRPQAPTAAAALTPRPLPRAALHTELDTPVGGWRWTPTVEAAAILQELAQAEVGIGAGAGAGGRAGGQADWPQRRARRLPHVRLAASTPAQVNLALLESTGISRAVAQLRTHPITSIARAAEAIAAKWRTAAVATLQLKRTAAETAQQHAR